MTSLERRRGRLLAHLRRAAGQTCAVMGVVSGATLGIHLATPSAPAVSTSTPDVTAPESVTPEVVDPTPASSPEWMDLDETAEWLRPGCLTPGEWGDRSEIPVSAVVRNGATDTIEAVGFDEGYGLADVGDAWVLAVCGPSANFPTD